MSSRAPAIRRAVASLLFAAQSALAGAQGPQGGGVGHPTAENAGREALIARVVVNTAFRGDIVIVRDSDGRILVPAAEVARWGARVADAPRIDLDGEPHVVVTEVPGAYVRFDVATVTLEITFGAAAFKPNVLDFAPARRADVSYPADASVFLNYGVEAAGDESFGDRRYQLATELAARNGPWLIYKTTTQQWGASADEGFRRLITNLQYDDRINLRRLTLGDFFTPGFDLSNAVPMAGVSLAKRYSMDPYFIQYPTARFVTEVALPSTVQVKIDGNLVGQRQVQPGPVDIANITGVIGAQNVAVVIRDPFGREQVLQQPFFYAVDVGLAQGLHEYSYNVGAVRQRYGIESNDYGPAAFSAFHRYAFTDQLTLGLRAQATRDLYNAGPFGTFQHPRLGVVGGGVSVGGSDGRASIGGSLAYSYSGDGLSVTLASRYFGRNYAQLSDLDTESRSRANHYASGSYYMSAAGTVSAGYFASSSYTSPRYVSWNLGYTLGTLGTQGLLTLNYIRTEQPASSFAFLFSFRYSLDPQTYVTASVGASPGTTSQAVSLQRALPQGEGVGYDFSIGHLHDDGDAAFGRAYVQANTSIVNAGVEYARASRGDALPGLSRVFVSGSVGIVDGAGFVSRPIDDSFALVRVGVPDVPVYANSWYVGRTNARGDVVANNIASYYDNAISFSGKDLALDFVYPQSEKVISPGLRSGSVVRFEVRRQRAVHGVLVDPSRIALEFREFRLRGGGREIASFTARHGEFYVEGVDPGAYELRAAGESPCVAAFTVPEEVGAATDIGAIVCRPMR